MALCDGQVEVHGLAAKFGDGELSGRDVDFVEDQLAWIKRQYQKCHMANLTCFDVSALVEKALCPI